jgi:hypothetical protein
VNPRWVPIPETFQSLQYDGLFTKCIECERELLDGSCLYWIERVFRGTEPIFEMAMCMTCREKIAEELSEDSRMRINAYVEERLDVEMRHTETQQWPDDQLDLWLERCALTKRPLAECRTYQIAGACVGPLLSIDMLPIMISDQAGEEMQKLMSKKTRDRLGDMVNDYFGMPPEFADEPQGCSPLLW